MEITAAALAAELCGASQEDPLLAVLCEAAEAAWENRLDPGVTKEDCGGALRCAAAFMAAADYLGKRALCTSTHKEHYEQKSIMYSTSIKSSETEHFTLFHCA